MKKESQICCVVQPKSNIGQDTSMDYFCMWCDVHLIIMFTLSRENDETLLECICGAETSSMLT